jgi:LacI family transcriptional regulator
MEQRVRGILLTRASTVFERPTRSLPRQVPVIFVDLESGLLDHCSTSVDDPHGSMLAVNHLHDLGHRQIAWVGPTDVPQMRKRADAVRMTTAELGIPLTEVVTPRRTDAQAGQIAALELQAAGMPSAVICGNDSMAVGMEMQLAAIGLSVPGDVSIVGFDDIEFAAAAVVPLTTVARHPATIGSSAIDLLLSGCGTADHTHRQVVLPAELVVRESTGPSPEAV